MKAFELISELRQFIDHLIQHDLDYEARQWLWEHWRLSGCAGTGSNLRQCALDLIDDEKDSTKELEEIEQKNDELEDRILELEDQVDKARNEADTEIHNFKEDARYHHGMLLDILETGVDLDEMKTEIRGQLDALNRDLQL